MEMAGQAGIGSIRPRSGVNARQLGDVPSTAGVEGEVVRVAGDGRDQRQGQDEREHAGGNRPPSPCRPSAAMPMP